MDNRNFGAGFGFGGGKRTNQGAGKGRNKGGAFGPNGYCVCTHCGEKIQHQQGVKCSSVKCPKCGHTMVREELLNKK